jgi:predicted  nucleic acid-binding Zn ribbon protein
MILANISFGSLRSSTKEEFEEVVECYLVSLFRGGQICGERFLTWNKGKLNAHVLLAAPNAMSLIFHTTWGKKNLAAVVDLSGREPVWKILDDDAGKTSSNWKGAPILYLFTTWVDWYSPVCRGDGKRPVPLYRLPVSDLVKDDLYGWQRSYRNLDDVWMNSGPLEMPAYRQLADPRSDLSEEGRKLCLEIETATGIPTFYYLMRYWRHSKGESERLCPGCGRGWKTSAPKIGGQFHQFDFRCEACRLVSHLGKDFDGSRRARIGEFVRIPE